MPLPLWTPYTDDEALDLRKPGIKREPASPPPAQRSPDLHSSPDYASLREVVSSASPDQMRFVASPMPYLYASPAYASNSGTFQGPEQIQYVQHPLAYQYAGPERIHQPVSPVPQYYQYPTPAPQISPASGSNGSRYEDAAYPKPSTLSPPESPPAENKFLLKTADSLSDNADFLAFERNALRAMALKNGGSLLGNNPRMRRTVHSTSQNAADDSYKTQRQRNNFAAKQSRDRRKLREIHLALKVTYLSNQVASLKAQLASGYCGSCHQPGESRK